MQQQSLEFGEQNLKIPLANGNVMNIPLSAINISEEVNKTGIWQQVNQSNKLKNDEEVIEQKVYKVKEKCERQKEKDKKKGPTNRQPSG